MAKEKVKSPVTHPQNKFAVGQEVSVEGGSRGKILGIGEDGLYEVTQVTVARVAEKKLAAV
jgi:preprotein translocase subunit YajC